MALISVVGLGLIGYSRYEAQHPVVTTTTTTSTIGPNQSSRWYAALAFDVCGKVTTLPVSTNTKTSGIISVGNGIIFISPGSVPNFQAFSGNLATLQQFVTYYEPKMVLTSTELQLPGKNQKVWHNGDMCGTQPGMVQIEQWKSVAAPDGELVTKGPGSLKFANGQMITVAFLPKGATIPRPPKATQSELLIDFEASQQTPTSSTVPGTLPVTTTTAKGGTTTTVKGGTTTTVAGGSTTTTTTAGATTTTTSGATTTTARGH